MIIIMDTHAHIYRIQPYSLQSTLLHSSLSHENSSRIRLISRSVFGDRTITVRLRAKSSWIARHFWWMRMAIIDSCWCRCFTALHWWCHSVWHHGEPPSWNDHIMSCMMSASICVWIHIRFIKKLKVSPHWCIVGGRWGYPGPTCRGG